MRLTRTTGIRSSSAARRRGVGVGMLAIILLASGVVACPAAGAAVSHPFGGHTGVYAAGTLFPSVGQATRDDVVRRYYSAHWKANFVRQGCGNGRYYILTPDANVKNVAEGQGYGMVVAVMMAGADDHARTIFDGLYRFVLDHPSIIDPDLMAAENTPCDSVHGKDSATDGDLDIAYGLLLAHAQWGSDGSIDYLQEAKRRIGAIKKSEMNPDTRLTMLGDWAWPGGKYYYATRTSDFMIDHFRAFRAATGDDFWARAVTRHQDLIATLQSKYAPKTGLVPDFVVHTNTTPEPAPGGFLEGPDDGRYSYNACRVPWRLGSDAVLRGDATSRSEVRKMTAWIRQKTGDDPARIRNGYTLGGSALESGGDAIFVAPFGVAAMSGPSQGWLDSIWDNLARSSEGSGRYYATALKLQALLVMSGNSWVP